jgi:putative colanic acid biosynthesis acetyltransferase WcaF
MIDDADVPVVSLSKAPGERAAWGRPMHVVFAWAAVELLLVRNPWQISSKLRVWALRKFGAEIGNGVIFRPDTRVKFPWKLSIGDNCWIGEGVWFHNQEMITLGHDVVISQQTMLTTGSHKHRTNMALVMRPIIIHDGCWITSRCLITGGVTIGRSALIAPMTVISSDVPPNMKVTGQETRTVGKRFQ